MKIYTAYSNSHKVFLPWFNTIKNVEPNITPIFCELDQKCPTGEFSSEGWNDTTKEKLEFILDIVKTDTNEYFIFSDIDVQFFKPVWNLGEKALSNYDIVFQNDYYGAQCTGFFYCKNNSKTKQLFEEALKIHNQHRDDQTSIQAALRIVPEIKHALLPKEYFTLGMFYDHWHGQPIFKIPQNIIVHHANWVMGVDNKLKLLEAVKNNYTNKNFFV